jgi:hypothetical protein
MSENEYNQIEDLNNDVDLEMELEDETVDETPTQQKPKMSLEAKRAMLARQLSRLDKKLGNNSEKPESKKEEVSKEGLDRIDRAILRGEKITSQEEIELVESIKRETGKDVEAILESRYFKSELKALREDKMSEEATPKSNNRANSQNRNTVDYWLAKGEMPPISEPKLRQDYVNAKISREKSRSQFSDNPVIG